jgi:hypothetical protein
LTRAERALFQWADVNNVGRGDYAGTTGNYESYQLMHDTRQGLVNGLAAALYHLFEQQLCHF